MKKSIGIDLGMDVSTVAVVDAKGDVVARETVSMVPKELGKALRKYRGCRAVMEVGTESGWVSRLLRKQGLDVRCVNARKLKMIAGSTLKTDELDAEILARLARISTMDPKLLKAIHVRSEKVQQERSAVKARGAITEARTKLINAARGLSRTMGHRLPPCKTETFVHRVRRAELPAKVMQVLEPMLCSIESLTDSIAQLDEQAVEIARQYPVVALLQDIPGVGLQTALWFVLCVENPDRFLDARYVGPYFGLRPIIDRSSTINRHGHITKAGDVEMRRLLTQAAHCLLNTKRRPTALKEWGTALMLRVGRKRAIPAIARKLAVLMLTIWKTGETFRPHPRRELATTA